jgi:hypothetical protein
MRRECGRGEGDKGTKLYKTLPVQFSMGITLIIIIIIIIIITAAME